MWIKKMIDRLRSEKKYVVFVTYKEGGKYRDNYMVTESKEFAEDVYREHLTDSRTYSTGISLLLKGTDWL